MALAQAVEIGRCRVPDPTPVVVTCTTPAGPDWVPIVGVGLALAALAVSLGALWAAQRSYQFSGFQLISEKMERHRETVRLILTWKQGMWDVDPFGGARQWPTTEDLRAYCADMNEVAFLCMRFPLQRRWMWSRWLSPEIVPRVWVKRVWGQALARVWRHERFRREYLHLQTQDRQLGVLYAYFGILADECQDLWKVLLDLLSQESKPHTPEQNGGTESGGETPQQSPPGE